MLITSVESGSSANHPTVFEAPSDIYSTADIKFIRIAMLHFSPFGIAVKGIGGNEARLAIEFEMQLDLPLVMKELPFCCGAAYKYDDKQQRE
jgi:hypothetical protein